MKLIPKYQKAGKTSDIDERSDHTTRQQQARN